MSIETNYHHKDHGFRSGKSDEEVEAVQKKVRRFACGGDCCLLESDNSDKNNDNKS